MRLSKSNFYDDDDYERMPILFCIYSKLHTTPTVFEAIRKSKPKKLYVFSDGPKIGGEKEDKQREEAIIALRKFVVENTDWDCEVFTKFCDKNLGCKNAIESAVDWFFENEEMGIILEDDTLPAPGFFRFCSELLIKYKDEEKLWMIKGHNECADKLSANSYFFKDNAGASEIWGWATWRRAWKKHDKSGALFEKYAKICDGYENGYDFEEYIKHTQTLLILAQLREVLEGRRSSWSYLLKFSIAVNGGLFALSDCNLVANIGCSAEEATNTGSEYYREGTLPTGEILFPLEHPEYIKARPLTAEEYVASAVPKSFQKEFDDMETDILSAQLAVRNFLASGEFFGEEKIAEKFRELERKNIFELIDSALSYKKYTKAQKYLFLALRKSALVGDKNFCARCSKKECLSFCPTKSTVLIKRKNGEDGVEINPKTCKYCWNCVKICPTINPKRIIKQ